MQQILQYLADEISASTDFAPHKEQTVPPLKSADGYHTAFQPLTHEELDGYWSRLQTIRERYANDESTRKTESERIWKEMQEKKYPNGALLYCCAGMGDNEAVVTVEEELGAFRLNIGNNDIQGNKTGWVEKIKAMNVPVEEAECLPELRPYARDCTCGIVYGFGEMETALTE